MDLIKEAKPLELKKVDDLIFRLEMISIDNSDGNIIKIAALIEDISAHLIALSTLDKNNWDFTVFADLVRKLLAPLIDAGYVRQMHTSVISSEDNYLFPFYFIFPPEDEEVVEKIKTNSRIITSKEETKPIVNVDNKLVHVHADTVGYKGKFGRNKAYIARKENPLENILLGRGANDMKNSIAVMVIVLFILYKLDQKPPIILMSNDEELSSPGSKTIFNILQATDLALDLEPSSFELATNETTATTYLKVSLDKSSPYNKVKTKLGIEPINNFVKQQILNIAERYYPKDKFTLKLTCDSHTIILSVFSRNFMHIPELNEDMKREIGNTISLQHKISSWHVGYLPDLQSDLSTKNHNLLNTVLPRRRAIAHPNLNQQISDLNPFAPGYSTAYITHNFETALSVNLHSRFNDLIIMGARPIGERHSNVEASLMDDNVKLAKSLVEIFCDGKDVFKEA